MALDGGFDERLSWHNDFPKKLRKFHIFCFGKKKASDACRDIWVLSSMATEDGPKKEDYLLLKAIGEDWARLKK